MSFLEKVERCNRRDLGRLVPFCVDGQQLGWLTPERADTLRGIPSVFAPRHPTEPKAGAVLVPTGADRSAAVADITSTLAASGLFQKPRGELYAVKNRWADAEALRLDRALVPGFGARAYGVHINGYLRKKDGLHLWIGTRAGDRQVEPGKLDNMVAGGQPADLGLMENVIKESEEEAALSADVARKSIAVGTISYAFDAPEGLKMDTLFCYDLEVPVDVIPQPSEEIVRFELMPIGDVLALIRDTDRFKFNVNLVILDFAMRHGVLDPDREFDYQAVAAGLREQPQLIV